MNSNSVAADIQIWSYLRDPVLGRWGERKATRVLAAKVSTGSGCAERERVRGGPVREWTVEDLTEAGDAGAIGMFRRAVGMVGTAALEAGDERRGNEGATDVATRELRDGTTVGATDGVDWRGTRRGRSQLNRVWRGCKICWQSTHLHQPFQRSDWSV